MCLVVLLSSLFWVMAQYVPKPTAVEIPICVELGCPLRIYKVIAVVITDAIKGVSISLFDKQFNILVVTQA